jgi:predicted HTH domain antitoxin
MTIMLNLPEDIARRLTSHGEDPARAVLEGLAIESYRSHALSEEQIRRLLGFETRIEVHGFLKEHGVYLNYTVKDLQQDIRTSESFARR